MNNITEDELAEELTKWFNKNENKFNSKHFIRHNKVFLTLKKHLIQLSHWRKKRKEGIKVNQNSLKNLKSFKSNKMDASSLALKEFLDKNKDKHNN